MRPRLRLLAAALGVSLLASVFGFGSAARAGGSALPPHTGAAPKSSAKLLSTFYHYAYAFQSVANTGMQASLRIENPYLNPADYHSLGEIDVEASTGPSGARQIVELGWTKDPVVNGGSTGVHLFAGCWINGVFQGYNTGCGYIDEVTNPINLGANISAAVGSAKNFRIQYASNAWWLYYDGAWVGRFLASSWTTPTFTQAAKFQAFGEVAAVTATPCTDMFNGLQGSTYPGPPLPGYSASAYYLDAAGVAQSGLTNMTFGSTDATKWSFLKASGRSGGLGGPGWNAAGTATGTAGSC